MAVSIKGYYKPTPSRVRQVSDAIDKSLKIVGASTIVGSHPEIGLALMIVGEVVKIFSNFFVEP